MKWLKPFGAEWTLHGIREAKTESEAKAILKNWIYKACMEEVVNEMIEGMRKAERINALWWLEELRQPKRYISALSSKGKDLVHQHSNRDARKLYPNLNCRLGKQRVHQ